MRSSHTTLAGHFPVSHMIDMTTAILHPDDHSIFHFQYSANKIHKTVKLYYKMGFVGDDLAQMQAHVRILSTLKIGEAKLECP